MRIDISHLVLVTSSDTSDHVVNKRLDSSQSSNVLSVTVVDSDLDQSVVDLGEGDINVLQVLGQDTSWTSDLDDSGLDVNGNVSQERGCSAQSECTSSLCQAVWYPRTVLLCTSYNNLFKVFEGYAIEWRFGSFNP